MPKLLGEFLQEKQEPFALEVYLLERGYHKVVPSCHISPKILKGFSLKKRSYSNPNCSNFLKSVFNQLGKIKKSANGDGKNVHANRKSRGEENAAEVDYNFSSASSNFNVFNFDSSTIDKEDTRESMARNDNLLPGNGDRKLKWRGVEDSDHDNKHEQLSPVSVLEETESDEISPPHHRKNNIRQGESSTSIIIIPQYELKHRPTHYRVQEVQEFVGSNSCSDQYIINKRLLRETKQLLIDCVREVIENHRKRDKRREQLKKILGADELWKLVCENVWLWSQDSIDKTNIIHFLHSEMLDSAEEWSSFAGDLKQQKQDISMEVGDAILQDLISEIVTS